MDNYDQMLAWVHGLPAFSERPGLERIRRLLGLLGNPHDKLRFIHVAGTNGKGSATSMCANILRAAGYRVGLYISPFVVDFRERFQIDGKMISQEEFASLCAQVRRAYDTLLLEGMPMNEYDVITALSLLYFARNRCDIVCFEVGLGGRCDATNIIPPPEVAVIMKIAYDHTAVLGDTIEQIASEKAGIIKRGSVCVCYPEQEEGALGVLMGQCAEQGAPLVLPNRSAVERLPASLEGERFRYNGEEYALGMLGEHQILNAVTAIEAIGQLRGFRVSPEQLRAGLKATRFPARMEILARRPLVILDGAHNQNGVQALMKAVGELDASPRIAVAGMLADKDCAASLKLLRGAVDALILTEVESSRAATLEHLASAAEGNGYPVYTQRDLAAAYEHARLLAGEDGAVVVFGSLFLASDMRAYLLGGE